MGDANVVQDPAGRRGSIYRSLQNRCVLNQGIFGGGLCENARFRQR